LIREGDQQSTKTQREGSDINLASMYATDRTTGHDTNWARANEMSKEERFIAKKQTTTHLLDRRRLK
jgi:hypothetical protein